MSAFTIAFLVPNTVRSLFADAAIQAAFVPVFTEKLEHGERREAFRLASTPDLPRPLRPRPDHGAVHPRRAAGRAAVRARLRRRGHSTSPCRSRGCCSRSWSCSGSRGWSSACSTATTASASSRSPPSSGTWRSSPCSSASRRRSPPRTRSTPTRSASSSAPWSSWRCSIYDLRNTPFGIGRALLAPLRVRIREALANADVRRVLMLMLPVTISLGLINVNLLVNSFFGTLVSDQAPAGIDKAFRIYMLPQGIFSVAVSTVLFPTLARFAARGAFDDLRATMANGMRQIMLLLTPAAAAILVLSEPMIRLVYERGDFGPGATDLVSDGALLVRLLAPLQRPLPAAHADLLQPPAALAADRDRGRQPGDHGAVLGALLRAVRGRRDRRRDRDRDRRQRRRAGGGPAPRARPPRARRASPGRRRGCCSPRRRSPAVSFGVWDGLDDALGRGLAGQIVSLGTALLAGAAVYAVAVTLLRIPEASQIRRLAPARLAGRDPARRYCKQTMCDGGHTSVNFEPATV